MATTLTDVCNMALDTIGVAPITSLGTDGTPQDDFMSRNHVRLIKAVQSEHPWPELKTRLELNRSPGTLTLSALTVGTGRTATSSASFFDPNDVVVSGDGTQIKEYSTGSGVAKITGYTSATVVTVEITRAFTGPSPLAQNGWYLDPIATDFDYCYAKPSDFLRLVDLDDARATWAFEGPRVLTDYDEAILHYIRYDAAPDNWGTLLLEAIVARLAAEAAPKLLKKPGELANLWSLYSEKLAAAKAKARGESQPFGRYSRSDLADVR